MPGVSRRPQRDLAPRDMPGLLKAIGRWQHEARSAGREVARVVLTYEAGRDGFWIARHLRGHGIEVEVMHAASIPVPHRGRRAKTDRIDLDMLLRSFLAWLRGEPRACSMVHIPSEADEDARRPGRERERLGRERERLGRERVKLENRIQELLCLHGIAGFKPRLKSAPSRLEQLRSYDGKPLPAHKLAELRRLLGRHGLVSDQIKQLEAERDQVKTLERPDRAERMILLLDRIYGLGMETARLLVREVLCRRFRNRQALAGFVGLTGTPFNSGGMEREQGISRNGNGQVRRMLMQLTWRWLRFQPHSALSQWFVLRTAGGKKRIRKIMAVAVARKLLVALWRYVETGEVPQGVRFKAA